MNMMMTKRQIIAAQVLQGFASNPVVFQAVNGAAKEQGVSPTQVMAAMAVQCADVVLQMTEQQPKGCEGG